MKPHVKTDEMLVRGGKLIFKSLFPKDPQRLVLQ